MTGLINKTRADEIHRLFLSGKTMTEIGVIYKITHQAVSNLMKRNGYDVSFGGSKKKSSTRKLSMDEKREERLFHKHGMGYKEYRELLSIEATYKYQAQRRSAGARGIPWHFNLKKWWDIWSESGKWELRGCGGGKYVMARFGDIGPYSSENVKIITNNENSRECREKHSPTKRHALGYAPKPPSPPLATWRAPDLSQQEQEERNKLIESGQVPF